MSFHVQRENKRLDRRKTTRMRRSAGASGPIRREFGSSLIGKLEVLCAPRTVTGVADVIQDLGTIAIAITAAVLIDGLIVPLLAVLYIGIRQRYLANLTHECAHAKLVNARWANDALGHFMATILGESFAEYQEDHRVHHAKLGRDGDPKLRSYSQKRATTPSRDKREFIVNVVLANAAWGLPKSAVTNWFTKPAREKLTMTICRAASWLTVLTLAILLDALEELTLYWLVPLAFVKPVINWLTDLGNHAGVIDDDDPIRQTRGWTSHALTRHIFGGHADDMYHPVHHWCPRIPWRKLPDAAALVRANYARWDEVPWCSGFFFRRKATPNMPSVIEDIVTRLRRSKMTMARPLPGASPSNS